MEKFVFTCPLCGNQFYAQEEWIGKTTDCPNCKQSICIAKQSNAMPTNHNLQMSKWKTFPPDVLMWTIWGGMGGGVALCEITLSCRLLLSLTTMSNYWVLLSSMIGVASMGSVMYQIKTRAIIGMTMFVIIISFYFWRIIFWNCYPWNKLQTPELFDTLMIISRVFLISNWCISIAIGLVFYFLAQKTKYHQVDCA